MLSSLWKLENKALSEVDILVKSTFSSWGMESTSFSRIVEKKVYLPLRVKVIETMLFGRSELISFGNPSQECLMIDATLSGSSTG